MLWLCAIGLIMSIIILVTDKTNKFAGFMHFNRCWRWVSLLLPISWSPLLLALPRHQDLMH